MDDLPTIASANHETDKIESPSTIVMQEQSRQESPNQQVSYKNYPPTPPLALFDANVPQMAPDDGAPTGTPTLVKQPFEALQATLTDLEINDPKLAFQAARIVGLFRRLWESCVSKQAREMQLTRENHSVQEAIGQLETEKDDLCLRFKELKVKLDAFNSAWESSKQRAMDIMDTWRQCDLGDLDSVIMDVE